MAISILQSVTQFRQAVRKFFYSLKAESASLEPGLGTLSFLAGRLCPDEVVRKNAYSESDFAAEMKFKLQGLPSAFIVDEKDGSCLMYDRMIFLIKDSRICERQYFFRDRRIFVQELNVLVDDDVTVTINLPGKGPIPFVVHQ